MPKLDPQFIIPFAKPAGMTSFSSLWHVKNAFGTQKIGHTGTLDSFADGLLVLLSGKLTKLVPYITDFDKTYLALFYFGKETDTLDPEGTVIVERPLPVYADFVAAVAQLTGTLQQIPPVYSAVKQNGERLSDKIRRGETVRLEPRTVTVYSSIIENIFFEDGSVHTPSCVFSGAVVPPSFCSDSRLLYTGAGLDAHGTAAGAHADREDAAPDAAMCAASYADRKVSGAILRVHCSKGTYIRSLVRDIARSCGSASFVYALRRTAVGPFTLEQAAGASSLLPFGSIAAHAELCSTVPLACCRIESGADAETMPYPVTPEALKQAALPLTLSLARTMHFQTVTLHEAFYPAFIAGQQIRNRWFSYDQSLSNDRIIAVFYQGTCVGLITKKGSSFVYQAVFAQKC